MNLKQLSPSSFFTPRIATVLALAFVPGCMVGEYDESLEGPNADLPSVAGLDLPGKELTSTPPASTEDFLELDLPTICFRGDLVNYEDIDGELFVYDDVEVDPEDIWCETDDEESTVYGGIKDADSKRKWGPTVYYYFDSRSGESFTTAERNAVRAAFAELDDVIPALTFVEKDESGKDRIRIRPHKEKNSSKVGRRGGKQTLNLTKDLFFTDGNGKLTASHSVHHEIMHALGMMHEHQRIDRPLSVFENKIKSGKKHNFKVPKNQKRIYDFDFDSVMLYSSTAFAKEAGDFTMLKWDGTSFGRQRDHLSELDKQVLRAMYPELRVPTSRIYAAGVPLKICELEGRPNDPDTKWIVGDLSDSERRNTNEISYPNEEGILELNPICALQSWFWDSTKPYPNGSALTELKGDANWHFGSGHLTLVPVSAAVTIL